MHGRRAFLKLVPAALCALVLPAAAGNGGGFAEAFGALTPAQRQQVQSMLVLADLYQGDVDGVWGPETEQAIAASVRHIIRRSQGQDLPDVSTRAARAAYLRDLAQGGYDMWMTPETGFCVSCIVH